MAGQRAPVGSDPGTAPAACSDAYIAIGSNLGDKLGNCRQAVAAIEAHPDIALKAGSGFYRTAPVDYTDQDWFVNASVNVSTRLEPLALLDFLKSVERSMGRRQGGVRFGPRPIDLDIALYGGRVVREEGLEIPDPDIRRRAFLAVPLLELAPDAVMPDTGETLASIVEELDTDGLAPDEAFTRELKARLLR